MLSMVTAVVDVLQPLPSPDQSKPPMLRVWNG
jgi:hypothetical protein